MVTEILQRVSGHQKRTELLALLKDLGLEGLTREQQLQILGLEIQKMKSQGHGTKYLESLVDILIGISAEPEIDDQELASIWEQSYRGKS